MRPNAFLLHPTDNVAVATRLIPNGDNAVLGEASIAVRQDIPRGHKLATRDIAKGETILKYGEPIGTAKEDIPAGSHVHVHNLDADGGS